MILDKKNRGSRFCENQKKRKIFHVNVHLQIELKC